MITYNPKDWFTFIFKIHKEDTFKELYKMMVFLGVYCLVITFLETQYFKLPQDAPIKNVTLIHTLLGFVLSMLLVFRTNTAYDRWWEGRKFALYLCLLLIQIHFPLKAVHRHKHHFEI